MKRTVTFFLVIIILLVPVSVFSESNYDNARQIAHFMETHYGVTILIGPECSSATTGGFTLGDQPEGRSPFLKMLGGKNYENEIQIIDDSFSIYPSGFFDHFICEEAPNGLRILLADQIVYNEESMAGVSTISDGYYNIFLGVGAFQRTNIHHEIWHVIEFRILYDNPHAFDNWNDLNPDGFEYEEDNWNMDKWDSYATKDEWFVRGYSTIDEYEDRATIIEALFQYDTEWWSAHPGVVLKYNKMMEVAEPIFGKIYNEGE